MMDFVRRLAPRRDGDSTRAVGVLPSRFASERPMRATVGEAPAAHPQSVTDVQPLQAALDVEPTRGETVDATPLTRPLLRTKGEAPDVDSDARALPDRHSANSMHAKPGHLETHNHATAEAPHRSVQNVTAPLASPRVAQPLSQAILAQRPRQSDDDGQVVHVTIGRIDVVANTTPSPAVRRSPKSREPKVTLADYLRGGNGNRR
jgi:hypothetical protein